MKTKALALFLALLTLVTPVTQGLPGAAVSAYADGLDIPGAEASGAVLPVAVPTEAPIAELMTMLGLEPTVELTAEPTPTPELTATPEPTAVPTPEPTATPVPTVIPTAVPTPAPTAMPTPTATAAPVAQPTPTPKPLEPAIDTQHNALFSPAFTWGWVEIAQNAPLLTAPGDAPFATLSQGVGYALSRPNPGDWYDCLVVAFGVEGMAQTAYIPAEYLRPMSQEEIAGYLLYCAQAADVPRYQSDPLFPLLPVGYAPVLKVEPTATPEPTAAGVVLGVELEPTLEPTGTPEPAGTPESTGIPEPTATPEPTAAGVVLGIELVPALESTATPESAATPEPKGEPVVNAVLLGVELVPTPEPTSTPEPVQESMDNHDNASSSSVVSQGWVEIAQDAPLFAVPGEEPFATLSQGIGYALPGQNPAETGGCLTVAFGAEGIAQTACIPEEYLRPLSEEETAAYLSLCAQAAEVLLYQEDPLLPLLSVEYTPVQGIAMAFAAGAEMPVSLLGAGLYNAGDIAVINEIIAKNGLNWTPASPADGSYVPADWEGVMWSYIASNSRIRGLRISSKDMTGPLDVSGLTALEELDCDNNHLTALDASDLTALEGLYCDFNNLTALNVSGLTALRWLSCGDNDLSALDVSGLTALASLSCYENNLDTLNVSRCTALGTLQCSGNALRALDVSGLTALEELYCYENNLNTLNISRCTGLKQLDCNDNALGALDVSGLTALERLNCERNRLTKLDVSGLAVLEQLFCSNNSLSTLDVSNCAALWELWCEKNRLNTLDVSSLAKLEKLYCGDNDLSVLDVSDCAKLNEQYCSFNFNPLRHLKLRGGYEMKVVPSPVQGGTVMLTQHASYIELTAIANRGYILNGWASTGLSPALSGKDASISFSLPPDSITITASFAVADAIPGLYHTGDIAVINDIIANNELNWTAANPADGSYVPADWTGVTWSDDDSDKRIVSLYLDNMSLRGALDVSGLIALEWFDCGSNHLSKLNVSGLIALKGLGCSFNDLTKLDVSMCANLYSLGCGSNNLTELDVSNCTSLNDLDCGSNNLTELDVSNCTSLDDLVCWSNNLTELDVSNCTTLARLYCQENNLSALDVSNCPGLSLLDCYKNNLTTLNVSNCTPLFRLRCDDNKLIELDISGLTALIYLNCDHNNLSALDVSGLIMLEDLSCYNNNLSVLDVSHCTALEDLICGYNNLSALDVSGLISLDFLSCGWNNLSELDVSRCTALEYLSCAYNNLSVLDVSALTALERLQCVNNNLSVLDVSNCTKLSSLDCDANPLRHLKLSGGYEMKVDLSPAQGGTVMVDSYTHSTKHIRLTATANRDYTFDGWASTGLTPALSGKDMQASFSLPSSLATITASFATTGAASGLYHAGDIAVINEIIAKNGLKWTPASPADGSYVPADWEGVTWSDGASNKRIIELTVAAKGLSGSLDASGLTALKELNCAGNILSALNVSTCVALKYLLCSDNNLSALDVSKCSALAHLWCENNGLNALIVTGCPALVFLYCENNNLSTMDVSKCAGLRYLNCQNNSLSALNVSKCTELVFLYCENNNLSTMDVSKCTELAYLHCENNSLGALNVSKNRKLAELWCHHNRLSSLNVSGLSLSSLYCQYNNMADESAVAGFTGTWGASYVFHPQNASISPKGGTFPPAMAGHGTQEAQQFIFTNTGIEAIANLSAALDAGSSFEVSAGLSATSLAPGGTATLSVRPRTGLGAGTHTGTLTIAGSNGVSATAGLSFTVKAVAYTATISPMDKAFPVAMAGYGIQVAQQFTITNTGTGTITNLSAVLNAGSGFEISAGLSATSLAPGGKATLSVRPRTGLGAGTYMGTLTIAGSNGVSATVGLSFTVKAVAYTAAISPTDKAFPAATAGYGTQAAQQFTITNTGRGTITSLYAALNAGSSFEISTGLSATSLAPDGKAIVGVRPRTGLGAGTHTGTLTIAGSNGVSATAGLSFAVNAAPVTNPNPGNAAPKAPVTFSVSNLKAPTGQLTKGNTFSVAGTIITASENITSLRVGIYWRTGAATEYVVSAVPAANAKSYQVSSAVDNAMMFRKLEAGDYTYKIIAVVDGKEYYPVSNDFDVVPVPSENDKTYKVTISAPKSGYGLDSVQTFTITNVGTGTITDLKATLGAVTKFEIVQGPSPTTLLPNDKATLRIRPQARLGAGTQRETLTITGSNGIRIAVGLSSVPPYAAAIISNPVNINPFTFPGAAPGYETQEEQTFIIENISTQPIENLKAALSANSNFVISAGLSSNRIEPNSTVTVKVRPKPGLSESDTPYEDTLTITGNNGLRVSAGLSFTVLAKIFPLPITKDGQRYTVNVLQKYSTDYTMRKGITDHPAYLYSTKERLNGSYSVIDIGAGRGTDVYAVLGGTIVFNGKSESGACIVEIEHADESVSSYGHLNWQTEKEVGQRVEAGEKIGKVGNTGLYSEGYHLHFIWSKHDPYCEFIEFLKINPDSGAGEFPHKH